MSQVCGQGTYVLVFGSGRSVSPDSFAITQKRGSRATQEIIESSIYVIFVYHRFDTA